MFDHMVAVQDTAFEAIKPGARCSDVDRAVRAYYDEHDLWSTGSTTSAIASGCGTTRARSSTSATTRRSSPGWWFTVEPGLYAEGLGGFRHSDTVAVTDDGIEFLTYYPRDLESLTLPA